MGAKSNIAWTQSTWNPGRGCRRKDGGCIACYAEGQAIRSAYPGGPFEGLVRSTPNGPRWTGEVSFDAEALGVPASWVEPRFVFVDSMSDLFYEAFTNEQIAATVGAMILAPMHVYQVLTKREARCRDFFRGFDPVTCIIAARKLGLRLSPRQAARTFVALPPEHPLRPLFELGGVASWPLSTPLERHHLAALDRVLWPLHHLWLGASCHDQESFDARADVVREFDAAAVRFLSVEPLCGPVKIGDRLRGRGSSIDWLIVGGESGHRARLCEVDWIRALVHEARTAGPQGDAAPVFVKQLGARAWSAANGLAGAGIVVPPEAESLIKLRLKSKAGADPAEWPDDLLAQDYPTGVYLPGSGWRQAA